MLFRSATIQDAAGNSASFAGVPATFGNLQVNVATATSVNAAYTAILRTQPDAILVSQAVSQIASGQLSLTQFENGLIAGEQTVWSTLPALVTIDAFYNATPSSALLTTVATATSGTVYYTAAELHGAGYSDPNVWTILGAGWGADPTSNFYHLYNADATGTTAGYTAFLFSAYQAEFGAAPASGNLQNLLGDIPGLAALLSGGGNSATPIQVMGGLYGYLLYAGQSYGIGHYAAAADAFLVAAANGTVTYGPELTAEFPATGAIAMPSAAVGAADPNVITVTSSNQLIDPGTGGHSIQFLADVSGDTLVLHSGGVDQVSGFNPGTDALDFGTLLSEANVDLLGDAAALGNYVTVSDQGADALIRFDPTGHGGGSTVAVLLGSGGTVTALDSLVARGAIRIA